MTAWDIVRIQMLRQSYAEAKANGKLASWFFKKIALFLLLAVVVYIPIGLWKLTGVFLKGNTLVRILVFIFLMFCYVDMWGTFLGIISHEKQPSQQQSNERFIP